MKYLHSMVRVRDLDESLRFYCEGLGLREVRRKDVPQGKYTLVFLSAPDSPEAEIELTYNWGSDEDYGSARNFGHLAFRVEDIYATCARLQKMGVAINRPPRDGHMAFVRSPDLISIELLQKGRVARLGTLGFDAEYWRLVSAKRGSGSLPNGHGRGADRSESEPDPLLLMRRLQRIRRARHRAFPRSRHRRATST